MALTNQQKQAARRKRQAALGRKEMRSVWVTDAEEARLKPMIRDALKRMRDGK